MVCFPSAANLLCLPSLTSLLPHIKIPSFSHQTHKAIKGGRPSHLPPENHHALPLSLPSPSLHGIRRRQEEASSPHLQERHCCSFLRPATVVLGSWLGRHGGGIAAAAGGQALLLLLGRRRPLARRLLGRRERHERRCRRSRRGGGGGRAVRRGGDGLGVRVRDIGLVAAGEVRLRHLRLGPRRPPQPGNNNLTRTPSVSVPCLTLSPPSFQ